MRGTTPFPNEVLDTYLPRLRDCEWRVLCVVIRLTCGWTKKDGTRKDRDWITNSQFRAKTGRGSDAVSSAIDSLVRQGFLDVHDEHGRALRSPAMRKSRFGRLYFSLGSVLMEAIATSNREGRIEKVETTKASITKETHNKRGVKNGLSAAGSSPNRSGWTPVGEITDTRAIKRVTPDLGT